MATSFDYREGDSRIGQGDVDSDALSAAITSAVADALEADPIELAPLYTAIDPDGLARVLSQSIETESPVTVTFQFEGCTVVVSSGGAITVYPPDEAHDVG